MLPIGSMVLFTVELPSVRPSVRPCGKVLLSPVCAFELVPEKAVQSLVGGLELLGLVEVAKSAQQPPLLSHCPHA